MVWAPGGYRFYDYTAFGLPLQLIVALVTIPVCLYENTWIIWTVVFGIANVITFTVFLGLNWERLGNFLRLNKKEQAVSPDVEQGQTPYADIVGVGDADTLRVDEAIDAGASKRNSTSSETFSYKE